MIDARKGTEPGLQTCYYVQQIHLTMSRWSDIIKFVRYDMWRRTNTELNGFFPKLGYATIRTIVLVIRGFASKNLNDTAKSITFSLIFAIVPILAMILAIAKGFGVADIIDRQLQSSFLKETDLVPTIMSMVDRYLETAQGGLFIGIGLVILLWAVYSFFQSVETSFNNIWNVKKSRSILRQFMTYIAILVLIPVLIVCSAGINLLIHTAIEDLPHLHQIAHVLEQEQEHVQFLQFLMCWLLFTLMYHAIPNTKVEFLSALIPGVIMGSLFQLLQMFSVYLIAMLSRTSIVYGAFATIPILMTMLQYTSLLILIGAEMSYAIQNNEEFEYEHDLNNMSRRYKDFVMLYLLSIIIRRFEADEEPLTSHELAIRDHLPIRLVNQLLSRLVETNIVREVYVEGKDDRTFQPALDTHKISLGMVLQRIDQQGTEEFLQAISPEMHAFWESYINVQRTHQTLEKVLVKDI